MTLSRPAIEHVVVLMLENRSFDSMLGRLYPKSGGFDGLEGTESNPWRKPDGSVENVGVWSSWDFDPTQACVPDPDPGELFVDMSEQIFGLIPRTDGRADMSGFVDNYMRQPDVGRPYDPRAVMHYFTPEQLPVMSALARAFAASDRWFASAPCETWPNRYFAHTGTAGGYVNNRRAKFPNRLPRAMPTIFRRLGARGYSWRVYFHDLAQSAMLTDLWPKIPTHFCLFEKEFARHAREGRLPNYSFIEPRYYPNPISRKAPSDQHPPHDVVFGEQLIAAIYAAVRNAPTWERTLFVITYDEHGGCYDHVPPPAATPPGGPYYDGFLFDRFGARVPAVVISPYTAPGGVIRPPDDGAPFDHCSVLSTLHKIFDIGPPLTPRVAAAPDLLGALTLDGPDNPGPERLDVDTRAPTRAELQAHLMRPRNGLQKSMLSPLTIAPAAIAKILAHGRRLGSDLREESWRKK